MRFDERTMEFLVDEATAPLLPVLPVFPDVDAGERGRPEM